jgi:hypothetical protein
MPHVLSLPLAAAYTLARLTVCGPVAPPAFELHYLPHDPMFHTGDSARELRARAPATAGINPSEFPVTSGLTSGSIRASSSILFETEEPAANQYCLWAKKVVISLSYRADVYIAREYREGSCRFAQTRAHEMRHVDTDLQTIQEYLPDLQRGIGDQLRGLQALGPVTDDARVAGQNGLLKQVESRLNAVLSGLEATRHRRQQAIDTPAEYRRLSAACPGEALPRP